MEYQQSGGGGGDVMYNTGKNTDRRKRIQPLWILCHLSVHYRHYSLLPYLAGIFALVPRYYFVWFYWINWSDL